MPSLTFTTAFAALALTALLATPASAGLTAFNGQGCTGAKSTDFACDGTCRTFGGRHSFRVDGGTGPHCVTTYVDGGCLSTTEKFLFDTQDGQCTTVATGTTVSSFRCAPNNRCEN